MTGIAVVLAEASKEKQREIVAGREKESPAEFVIGCRVFSMGGR
jgi:hypothetical protein